MRDGRIVEVMEVVGVEGSRVLFERYLPLHDTVLKRYRVAPPSPLAAAAVRAHRSPPTAHTRAAGGQPGCPGGKQVRELQPQRMLENARSKRELDLRGRTGLTTYLRASASFGSRRHSRAPSRPQAPQAARDGGWLEPAERASLWRSALSEPYRRNQHLNNSLQTRFQPRHPRGAAVRARRHPASIAISVPLRSGQRVAPAALE